MSLGRESVSTACAYAHNARGQAEMRGVGVYSAAFKITLEISTDRARVEESRSGRVVALTFIHSMISELLFPTFLSLLSSFFPFFRVFQDV